MGNLRGLSPLSEKVYQVVCRRFLSIFYPAAIYQKYSLVLERKKEQFFASFKVLSEPGYLKVADVNLAKKSSIQETFLMRKREILHKQMKKTRKFRKLTELCCYRCLQI